MPCRCRMAPATMAPGSGCEVPARYGSARSPRSGWRGRGSRSSPFRTRNPSSPASNRMKVERWRLAERRVGWSRRCRIRNPSADSVAVHAWRLRTADWPDHVRHESTAPYGRNHVGRFLPSRASRAIHATGAGPKEVADRDRQPENDELYPVFCRELKTLLRSAGQMKPKEVGDALDLIPGQTKHWLARAERDGLVRRTSKRPVKFGLRCRAAALILAKKQIPGRSVVVEAILIGPGSGPVSVRLTISVRNERDSAGCSVEP